MDYPFADLSETAARHLPLLGLFSGYVRSSMLAHYVGTGSAREDFYKTLTRESLDEKQWQDALEEAMTTGIIRPVGPGVFELHPSMDSLMGPKMLEVYGEEALKVLNQEFLGLYSQFCAEVLEDWGKGNVIPTIIVEEQNIIRAMSLAMDLRYWMDLFNISRCLAAYLAKEERKEEWKVLRSRLLEVTQDELGKEAEYEVGALWMLLLRDEANDDLDEGRLDEARAKHGEILSRLDGREDQDGKVQRGITLHQLGLIAYERENTDEAEANLKEALELFDELGYGAHKVNPLSMLGALCVEQGRFEEAVQYLAQAYPLALETGYKNIPALLNQMGLCLEQMGEQEFIAAFPAEEESHRPPIHLMRQVLKEIKSKG